MLFRLAALAFALLAVPANAADIHRRSDGWIVVQGPFVQSDGPRFRALLSTFEGSTTVVLESDGGSAGAAIGIGEAIKQRGFATLVERGKTCVSACAFAWLAGKPRIMDPDARLGFHGVYIMENGKPVTSGAANAVMGAYLGSLGLPASAIYFVTDAKPDGMAWLTQEKASALGFDVFVLDRPAPRIKSKKALLEELFRRSEAESAD